MNQVVLWAIALGLWANVAVQTVKAQVQVPAFSSPVERALRQMESYVAAIYNGTCVNRKICGP